MAPTKGKKRLEDNYYEFSVLEEFVEYENFTNSKDLADLALEKIESYLTSINSKLQFEEDKSKVNAYSNINLPKYDLPQFAGDFNSWLSFKSIFSSSIDSNESLTDIQKLQYLQNAVTSDASRLIKGFAITHENYKQAWETQLNRKGTRNLPNFIVSKFDWPLINGLQLADPSFYISQPVDMILVADIFFDLIQFGKISGTQNQPSALNSKRGSFDENLGGIIWNSKEDTFRINISPPNEVRPTKQQLLSTIAKIYDPLGFLSPTTIQLKILMQDIWKQNISWDDPITDCISESWTQFKNQMKYLAEIQITRYLSEDATAKRVLLICFCDASQRAYAAVFYLRNSQIVLDWLKLFPSRWKIFVANRILTIQKMTSEASWHHVKSQENPADCASREDVKCEEKSSTVLTNVSTSSQGSYLLEIIAKYSSFSHLVRVIAWCKGFIKNCRSSRVTAVLTSKEVYDATKIVIQTVQESQFHSEIQLLKKKHPLPNSSKLLPLADAFWAAFRRFVSRRGKPSNMFSDNATNSKGASSYLKEQLKLIKSVEVQNFVTQESITWHFIPLTSADSGKLASSRPSSF
ncbi:integrase catalytic domain-containing protein [Trichonephila clavipes]|nr:integrase catalytic domain-containing protein [Trichonephila clavipes]